MRFWKKLFGTDKSENIKIPDPYNTNSDIDEILDHRARWLNHLFASGLKMRLPAFESAYLAKRDLRHG